MAGTASKPPPTQARRTAVSQGMRRSRVTRRTLAARGSARMVAQGCICPDNPGPALPWRYPRRNHRDSAPIRTFCRRGNQASTHHRRSSGHRARSDGSPRPRPTADRRARRAAGRAALPAHALHPALRGDAAGALRGGPAERHDACVHRPGGRLRGPDRAPARRATTSSPTTAATATSSPGPATPSGCWRRSWASRRESAAASGAASTSARRASSPTASRAGSCRRRPASRSAMQLAGDRRGQRRVHRRRHAGRGRRLRDAQHRRAVAAAAAGRARGQRLVAEHAEPAQPGRRHARRASPRSACPSSRSSRPTCCEIDAVAARRGRAVPQPRAAGALVIHTYRLCHHSKNDDNRPDDGGRGAVGASTRWPSTAARLDPTTSRERSTREVEEALDGRRGRGQRGCDLRPRAQGDALRALLETDPRVVLLGEDIADPYGGAFKVTRGLSTDFPDARACDADQRGRDRGRRRRAGAGRLPPDRRDHVRRLPDAVLRPDRQPHREVRRDVRRQRHLPGDHPHAVGRRPWLWPDAQPEPREALPRRPAPARRRGVAVARPGAVCGDLLAAGRAGAPHRAQAAVPAALSRRTAAASGDAIGREEQLLRGSLPTVDPLPRRAARTALHGARLRVPGRARAARARAAGDRGGALRRAGGPGQLAPLDWAPLELGRLAPAACSPSRRATAAGRGAPRRPREIGLAALRAAAPARSLASQRRRRHPERRTWRPRCWWATRSSRPSGRLLREAGHRPDDGRQQRDGVGRRVARRRPVGGRRRRARRRVETSKAVIDVAVPGGGYVLQAAARAREVAVGEPIAYVFDGPRGARGLRRRRARRRRRPPLRPGDACARPAGARRAAELGVDLATSRAAG